MVAPISLLVFDWAHPNLERKDEGDFLPSYLQIICDAVEFLSTEKQDRRL